MNGYIYVVSNPSYRDNIFKIGITTRSIEVRLKELYTTGVPGPFKLEYEKYVHNPEQVEKTIHNILTVNGFRYQDNREYFNVDLRVIKMMLDMVPEIKNVKENPQDIGTQIEYIKHKQIIQYKDLHTLRMSCISDNKKEEFNELIHFVLKSNKKMDVDTLRLISLKIL